MLRYWNHNSTTEAAILFFSEINMRIDQWWILDFPDGGTNPKGGWSANLLFGQISLKILQKWRKLDQEKGVGMCPKFYYVDPPLVTEITLRSNLWLINTDSNRTTLFWDPQMDDEMQYEYEM